MVRQKHVLGQHARQFLHERRLGQRRVLPPAPESLVVHALRAPRGLRLRAVIQRATARLVGVAGVEGPPEAGRGILLGAELSCPRLGLEDGGDLVVLEAVLVDGRQRGVAGGDVFGVGPL